MDISKFSIELFERTNGEIPAREFIVSLNVKLKARIFKYIDLLKENGNQLREPDSKYLKNGIFELRIQSGNTAIRLFYFLNQAIQTKIEYQERATYE